MKAFQTATSNAWAITPDALQMVLEVAARENPPVEAIEAKLGRKLDNTQAMTVRDGVATLPVSGPIFPKANLMTALSGATSVESMAQDFTSALENPRVKAIVLAVDSPGGAVSGVSEFADLVHAARGQKPIVAYAEHQMCSAAYWIASAADEIVANDTALLGSIGVLTAVPKSDKASAKEVTFVASQSPNKRADPETSTGANQIQTMVDDLASVFIGAVARNRAVDEQTVLSDFGQGGVMVGRHAVAAGLADRVGSYEALHAQLSQGEYEMPNRTTTAEDTVPVTAADDEAVTTALAAQTDPTPTAEGTPESGTITVAATGANASAPRLSPPAAAPATADPSPDFAALQARIDALEKQNEEMAAVAAAERQAAAALKREKEINALAATARDNGWHGDPEAHAEFMYALSADQREHFTTTMNAQAEQIKASGLFTAVGTSNPSGAFEDPEEELMARAKTIMADRNVGYPAAFAIARKENKELDAAYRAAHRAAPQA